MMAEAAFGYAAVGGAALLRVGEAVQILVVVVVARGLDVEHRPRPRAT